MQGEFGYTIKNGKVTITRYTGQKIDLVIPQYIEGMPVTDIGRAFCYSGLESVSIPEGIVSIGKEAFYGAESLERVKISASVTFIGDDAFTACSLKNIEVDENNACYSSFEGNLYNKSRTVLMKYADGDSHTCFEIPKGIISIGASAFKGCFEIERIKIPEGVRYIDRQAFCCCVSLTSIDMPTSIISIGDEAFLSCNSLENIEIPEGVVSIGIKAFGGCHSLSNIKLPKTLTYIGDGAFDNCRN